MQVVYVCGGKGRRLHPRPVRGKSLMPVGGAPLLTRLVDRFAPFHRSNKPPVVIVDADDGQMPRAVDALVPGARASRSGTPMAWPTRCSWHSRCSTRPFS